jgi:hypothetical protein
MHMIESSTLQQYDAAAGERHIAGWHLKELILSEIVPPKD